MFGNVLYLLAVGERQQAEADTRAAAQVCDESLTSYTHSGTNTTRNKPFTHLKDLLLLPNGAFGGVEPVGYATELLLSPFRRSGSL